MTTLEKVKGGLIVSCQALPNEPMHSSFIMGRFARAAVEGGAVGIRANTREDIAEIKRNVTVPIIGIVKRDYEGLRIEPAIPSDWDYAEITRRFRGDVYHIVYRRTGEAGLTVDSKKLAGSLIPCTRDGAVHLVEVTF